MQCSAVQGSAVQCTAVHCSAVQCRGDLCWRASWRDVVYNILILKSPKTRENSIFHKEVSGKSRVKYRGNKDKRYFQPHKLGPLRTVNIGILDTGNYRTQ